MVTQQEFEVHVGKLPLLLPDDLGDFDAEAVDLVLEYQSHGWTGRMSSKHHAIMRAPDGKATASIARKHKRSNRGGLNARRPLKQWLDRQRREHEEHHRRNAFGLPATGGLNHQVADSRPPWQLATEQSYEARLRMQKLTRDWWEDMLTAGLGKMAWQLMEDGEDKWILVDATREEKIVRVVAIGPAADPAEVEQIRAQAERFNQPKENPVQEDAGPLTGKEYPCNEPGCGRSFANQGGLNLHSTVHNPTDHPCPLCDRVLPTPAALGRHLHSKLHAEDPRLQQALKLSAKGKPAAKPKPSNPVVKMTERACEYCGEMKPLMSIGGHHRGHKKAGDVKIAERGDAATPSAKATTTPEPPTDAVQAATAPPAPPEPLVVQAVPAQTEPATLNGTGHAALPTDLLNQVRALVNPELVGDLERLRTERDDLRAKLDAVTKDRDDLQAWKDMMKEAIST